ncbi:cytochrome c [Hyphomicrobium sp.]|uniref:c-type cytochrome n=1 Tax=Hyphomicrobium sp. TaxID=82 RepID=UPI000FA29FE7|nr:cytochrome c [Hyphomicrobium sp.]RUO99169.1 MAG: c-type cytochrome [Hyphomicrobium sp.]
MSMPRHLALAIALAGAIGPARGDVAALKAPKLGTPLKPAEVSKWDRTIFPDGRGLPPGRGTAEEGRSLYAAKCASCHGARGEGATAEDLIGPPKPPTPDNPNKTIGAYWPFATTVFDFIARSMPPAAPGSLSGDEVYALTAFLLSANGVIKEDEVMTAATLPKVKMPNRDGFVWIDVEAK